MDRGVAYRLLATELASYRRLTYAELRQLVGDTYTHRVQVAGLGYEIDIRVAALNDTPSHILVDGTVGGIDWGSPIDRFDDHFISVPDGT